MAGEINLLSLFQAVTRTLAENQNALNQADTYNHDHGTNMVRTFQTVTDAVSRKKTADAGTQLAYASQMLRKQPSGSAQAYAANLSRAAGQYKGQQVTPDNAMLLLQSLLGGEPASQQGAVPADLLSTLLGGTGTVNQQTGQQAQAGDLLGSLLGGGQQGSTQGGGQNDGLDVGDLLNAGMAYMSARQRGASGLEGILQAVIASGQLGATPHRAQSANLVGSTIMNFIQAMGQAGTRR